jgi:hypothetical protein
VREIRPPRPGRGVVGYVAELQQFDPVPPAVYELTPPGPAPAAPQPRLSPVPAAPGQDAALGKSQIRQLGRGSVAVLGTAALAIVVGAGVIYAGLGGFSDPSPAATGGAAVALIPALPGTGPVTGDTTAPTAGAGTPVAGKTARARRPAPLTASAPAAATIPAVLPGRPSTDPASALPIATQVPAEPAQPPEPAEPDPSRLAVPPPLTATFSHVVDVTEDGYAGYTGTVRIDNPGDEAAPDWQVTLTVPGGNAVHGRGVEVDQDGESVAFTPDGDEAVPAGGSVTFSFDVRGTLETLPLSCAIDGDPCS